MNYPWEKKHTTRRLLGLTTALVLVGALFAGCSLLGGNEPSETDPGPNIIDNSTPPSSEPSSVPSADPSVEPSSEAPSSGGEDKTNIAIVKEQVSVRSSPSSTGNVLSTLDAGEEVEVSRVVTSFGQDWASLKQGWVPTSSLDMSNVHLTPDNTGTPQNPDGTEPADTVTTPTEPSGNNGGTNNGNTNPGSSSDTGNGNGVVLASQLNIREEPTTSSDKVGSLSYGDRVNITDTQDGWGKISKGWISLKYVYRDGDTGSNSCSGVVTASQLNKRAGPGTKYDKTGSLNNGDKVSVLQRVTINGTEWGYVSGGWICMDYVDTGDSSTGGGTSTTTGNGTVTASGGLNIRSGPGTDYDSVGGLKKGDRVTITESKDGWGRISEGWINLKYVDMD